SCGIVNRSGEWLLPPIYKNLVIPADGDEAVAVRDADSGLCGYVRWDGAWAIEPRFADATRMGPDGYALAEAVLR
ncbi:MAG: WG repeat-containing protein, partial [Coriobacteriaceae bacterium]|nr:WG repeat-containing protein [Coriobacteriaceae bacterium]